MAAKGKTDWDAVEPEYRAGVKSLRQIADEFGCTSGRVAQVARERGWDRDLAAKIKAKAEAKVSKSILSAELSTEKRLAETQVVEANAQLQADIILSHRKDVRRGRSLVMALMEEAEATTFDRDLFAQLGELMASPDENGQDKLNDIYRKVISMPGRTDTVKKLSESLKALIGLERQAFGLDEKNTQEAPATTFNLQF